MAVDLLHDLPSDGPVFVDIKDWDSKPALTTLMADLMQRRRFHGIYVSLTYRAPELMRVYVDAGLDREMFYIIDAVGGSGKEEDGSYFAQGPTSLTEISQALSKAIDSRQYQFVVFDSLSTLCAKNSPADATKFAQFIINRVRSADMLLLMCGTLDKRKGTVAETVSKMCSTTLHM